jgi:hypothetical protein
LINRELRRLAPDLCDVRAASLAFDQPVDGIWLSDHFGVVADLEVSTAPSA